MEIDGVDLQPCGGTHVANTAEIGRVVVTKIEKKSAKTRRVVLGFADGVTTNEQGRRPPGAALSNDPMQGDQLVLYFSAR